MANSPSSPTWRPGTRTPAPDPRATSRLIVDVGAVVANWRLLAERVRPAVCAAVVKADAYGLGAAAVAPALAAAGCRQFFVATLEEGIALRPLVGDLPIGVLGGLPPDAEADFGAHALTPVLNHLGEVERARRFAARRGAALPVFIHLDTGMNRLGLDDAERAALMADPAGLLEGLGLSGWISHLACADEPGHRMTRAQLDAFTLLMARLPAAPASLANSAGIFCADGFHFDLVRPGIALYGGNPVPGRPNPMQPVVTLEARLLQVRAVDTGQTVGYGASYAIRRPSRIATIGVGYADGYLRSLAGRGHVTIAGHSAPVVGRVSMDLVTVDVSGLPEDAVQAGGWAEVIGRQRPIDQVAAEAGTISYEILTRFGPRCHRIYV